jgi:hypothetical protein
VRPNRPHHPGRDCPGRLPTGFPNRPAKVYELFNQLGQNTAEPVSRLPVRRACLVLVAERLDHQIDRPVLQMQPPSVWKQRRLRRAHGAAIRFGC